MARPYLPRTMDAQWVFEHRFCNRCSGWPDEGRVCPIWARAMAYTPDNPNFPTEWTADIHGPTCSAFVIRVPDLPLDGRAA